MNDPPDLVLQEADVRAAVRLLADALTPDDGRTARVRRLADGLAERAEADGWIWIRTHMGDGAAPSNLDYVMGGGFDSTALTAYADWSLEVHGVPPENHEVRRLLTVGEHFTRSRSGLAPAAAWEEPHCHAHVRRMGFENFMYSFKPLTRRDGRTVFSGLMLVRRPGRPDFDARACRIAHLVFGECGDLHTDGLPLGLADDIGGLSPRLRSVLTLLIDGQSAVQIADGLGLSPHTVNDYVKQIHAHFNVSSRAELLGHLRHAGAETSGPTR